MEEEKKKPAELSTKEDEKNMSNYNVEHIKSLEEAFEVLHACYLKPFMEYCKSDFDKASYKASVKNFTLANQIVRVSTSKFGGHQRLYNYFKKQVQDFLQESVKSKIFEYDGDLLIKTYIKLWQRIILIVSVLKRIFVPIEQEIKNRNTDALPFAGFKVIRDNFMPQIERRLTDAVLALVVRDRKGEKVDYILIKEALTTYVTLGYIDVEIKSENNIFRWAGLGSNQMYDRYFEDPLKSMIQLEFAQKSLSNISVMTCPEYLLEVQNLLKVEENRANSYYQDKTKAPLMKIIEHELITKHAQAIVDKEGTGLSQMLKHQKKDELKLMYRIFKRGVDVFKFMTFKVSEYIKQRGMIVVNDQELRKDPVGYIQKLLDLYIEIDKIVEECFDNDKLFKDARNTAFQNILNEFIATPKFVACYCDDQLKLKLRGVSFEDANRLADYLIKLFCCLHARDSFIKSYKQYLSNRLLDKSSVNKDYELLFLQKLTLECGHHTINKLQSMFNDIQLSKDVNVEFKQSAFYQQFEGSDVSFTIETLTNGHWPDQKQEQYVLPQEMKALTSQFELFYRKKHSNRNLVWLFHHGQVEICPKFITDKTFTFVMSSIQSIIVLLFNTHEQLSFLQLQELTRIPASELQESLKWLCNPKQKILEKQNQKVAVFKDDETIKVFQSFQSQSIRCNFIPKKSEKKQGTEEEEKKDSKDDEEIKRERQNVIEAVIVRIMKARKTENHANLVDECMRQIYIFKAQPPMIRDRISSLMEREYLKRDETDRTKYIYLP